MKNLDKVHLYYHSFRNTTKNVKLGTPAIEAALSPGSRQHLLDGGARTWRQRHRTGCWKHRARHVRASTDDAARLGVEHTSHDSFRFTSSVALLPGCLVSDSFDWQLHWVRRCRPVVRAGRPGQRRQAYRPSPQSSRRAARSRVSCSRSRATAASACRNTVSRFGASSFTSVAVASCTLQTPSSTTEGPTSRIWCSCVFHLQPLRSKRYWRSSRWRAAACCREGRGQSSSARIGSCTASSRRPSRT